MVSETSKTKTRVLSLVEAGRVSGGMRNMAQFAPGADTPKVGPRLGAGEVDGIPWGGKPGDGSWGIVNNNLP